MVKGIKNRVLPKFVLCAVTGALLSSCQGESKVNPSPPEVVSVERHDLSQAGSVVIGSEDAQGSPDDSSSETEDLIVVGEESVEVLPSLDELLAGFAIFCQQLTANTAAMTDTTIHCRLQNSEGERFEFDPKRFKSTWNFAINYDLAESSLAVSNEQGWDVAYTAQSNMIVASLYAAELVDINVAFEDASGATVMLDNISKKLIGEDCDPNQDVIELTSPNSINVTGSLSLSGGSGQRIRARANSDVNIVSTQVRIFADSLAVIRDGGTQTVAVLEAGSQYDGGDASNIVFYDSLAVNNNATGENYAFQNPLQICD